MDSILDRLSRIGEWETFFEYKSSQPGDRGEIEDLRKFIDGGEYLPEAERIAAGGCLSVPEKALIRKSGSAKKRTVYMFPRAENYVLKLLTFLLLRKYDGLFADSLYSFRVSGGPLKAVGRVLKSPGVAVKFTYKCDISNYFNSIDAGRMIAILEKTLADDPRLAEFFKGVLSDDRAIDNGVTVHEQKGVMAGSPIAVFLANLYLSDLDFEMERQGFLYARYSDDILLLADTEEDARRGEETVRKFIGEAGLSINPEKESRTKPGEAWTFLGFEYANGIIDVSPVSRDKLTAKIRRKARAIRRWKVRKNVPDNAAVKAFLRKINKKLYFAEGDTELNWIRWFFPVINTDKTLKEIDAYVQQWARYVATGKHSKANYNLRYEQLKEMGYVSLVHEWYKK